MKVTLEPIVATSIRICPGAAARQVFLHVRESAATLSVWLVRDAIRNDSMGPIELINPENRVLESAVLQT